MPTVAEVWRGVFPRATPAADPPSREVGWVRVLKARVPAFDALESTDLAILPISSLRQLSETGLIDATGVVDAVDRAAGSAIVVAGGTAEDPLASEALERAVALGMGAFAIAQTDVQALERSVIGYLVNGRAELERQAAMLETQLERLALEARDLEAHAATIARFLGRPVAIERPRGRPIAVHAPADLPGSAAAAAAYLAQPRRAALRVPLPDSSAPLGALVLLGRAAPSELDRVAAGRVAGLLALELQRGPTREGDRAAPLQTGAASLPAAGPPWVAIVARQLVPDEPSDIDERERLRTDLKRLAPSRLIALRGDAASLELRVIAFAGADDPAGLAVASRVATLADRPVAVSRPFTEPEQRAPAEAEARATLEALEALSARLPDAAPTGRSVIGRADRLPAYRLLATLHDMPDSQRQARALLEPLLEGRPRMVAERLRTLRAVLDAEGLREAAGALGIHRNSLTYRLRRMARRTGWDLRDPSLRLALGIAVRIVQVAQKEEPESSENARPTPYQAG